MKTGEIRGKARSLGVEPSGPKQELIRRIQSAEGNQPCFGTKAECEQDRCCWREDCLPRKTPRVS